MKRQERANILESLGRGRRAPLQKTNILGNDLRLVSKKREFSFESKCQYDNEVLREEQTY
jgi:hypothetical protein